MHRLPRNVAILRIQEGPNVVTVVADELTHDQQLCARVFAAIIAAETAQPYVCLTKLDILHAMCAAA